MSIAPGRDESVIEFTTRAVVAGIFFGIIFGAANAYLGLKVGLTVSTSIPIAVLTVALFKLMPSRRNGMILEANISQTIGSASSSLATGTIFTIPALFLWGMAPPFWQVAILALLGGFLGIAAMVPLRRLLIVKSADELPYPEGTACAEVLRATTTGTSGGRWIFIGLGAGAVIKLAIGAFVLIPSGLAMHLPVLAKAELALEIAPALLAVGYILGYKQSAIMVSGQPDLRNRADAADRHVRRGPDRADVSRNEAVDRGDDGGANLVALRALHRRGRFGFLPRSRRTGR